jgi:hypothetical protein
MSPAEIDTQVVRRHLLALRRTVEALQKHVDPRRTSRVSFSAADRASETYRAEARARRQASRQGPGALTRKPARVRPLARS